MAACKGQASRLNDRLLHGKFEDRPQCFGTGLCRIVYLTIVVGLLTTGNNTLGTSAGDNCYLHE